MPWPLAANRRPIPANQTLAGAKRSHLQTASEMKPCLGTQDTSQLYHAVVDPPVDTGFSVWSCLIMWTLEPWLSGYKIPGEHPPSLSQFREMSSSPVDGPSLVDAENTACQRTCRLNFLDDLSGSCGLALKKITWSSVLMCIQRRIPKVTPKKIGQHISDGWYMMIYNEWYMPLGWYSICPIIVVLIGDCKKQAFAQPISTKAWAWALLWCVMFW